MAATAAVAVLTSGLLVGPGAPPAQADPVEGGQTPSNQVVDYPTFHRHPGSPDALDAVTGQSINPGRIWTDKTVFRNDAEANAAGVDHQLNIADDEMAVTLSSLGTTRQVQSTRRPVIDLVLVLDNSGSMRFCVDRETDCNSPSTTASNSYLNSRAYAMVEGVNAAITASAWACRRWPTRTPQLSPVMSSTSRA